jgi:hypothetical protein
MRAAAVVHDCQLRKGEQQKTEQLALGYTPVCGEPQMGELPLQSRHVHRPGSQGSSRK